MAEKMSLIMFSGDYDKAIACFTLATTGAALGMEITIFFTFWGLNVLRKKKTGLKNKILLQKIFALLNRGGINNLKLSRFNFFGLGPFLMRILMKQKKMSDVEKLLETAKNLGVKFIACTTSMEVMGLKDKDFVEGIITEYAGAATYLKIALESKINLFI